ncbi:unnamed protein product [Ceratitis capitata]|uniref:Ribonuclease n=1 Tax=Ceratitis capitata TaxID=7213 RepID=A0A811V7Q2_CERCA|nr:unnamed protein product [Ceratitis capitata]
MDSDQEEQPNKRIKTEPKEDEIKSDIKKEETQLDEIVQSTKASIKHEEDDAGADCIATIDKIDSLKSLGPFIAARDNSQNNLYFQDLPEICKSEPCMLGVDEAGRGPVLGPMVYGIAFCPITSEQILVDLGCADSKQLTEEKRENIFNEMNIAETPRACLGWAVELISPNVISTSMLRRSKCSLNEVSMNSAIGLIQRAVEEGVNIAEVYVDTVGPPEKYQDKLKAIFPQFKITVAKKADSTYPIVSAASICAKVTRDTALKVWKFPESNELNSVKFGSGYPGDPVTKRFLTENVDMFFGFPRLVRFSWATAENALADKAMEMEFDEPDDQKPKYAGPKLTQFFKGATKTGAVQRKPCRFLKSAF